jgi:hypothetical protein
VPRNSPRWLASAVGFAARRCEHHPQRDDHQYAGAAGGGSPREAERQGCSHRPSDDRSGRRIFPALRSSTPYVLTIEHENYRALEYDGLQLESGRPRVLDVKLRRPGEREVVFLASRDPFPWDDLVAGLREQLDLPLRIVDLDEVEEPDATVRLVRAERPNLMITAGLQAGRLVRREVRDIPAIFTLIGDPRRHDLESTNICFVTNQPSAEELAQRLADILPEARRIGLVYDAHASAFVARDMRRALRGHRMDVEMRPCYRAEEIDEVLDALTDRVDALAIPYDPLMMSPGISDRIIAWALRHRVPLAAPAADWVKRGALFSHGATPATISFDVAWVASQILFHGRSTTKPRLRSASRSLPTWSSTSPISPPSRWTTAA